MKLRRTLTQLRNCVTAYYRVKLSEEQIAEVCKIYFDWATTASENYAKPELYYAAHLDEIREKGFSLVPSRYIEFVDRDTEIDYQSALTQLRQK